MTQNPNIVDALKAVIATRNWDMAGELADEHQFADCLRCFAAPRRFLFDRDVMTPGVFMCLFCASCWYEHEKHRSYEKYKNVRYGRSRVLAECEVCNVIGAHRSMEESRALANLRMAERRFLSAFGWRKNGDTWDPPKDQTFKYASGYSHNHAVNALKHRQGESRGPKQPTNPRWSRHHDDD